MVAPVLANLGPLENLTLKPNPQEVNQNINWDTVTQCITYYLYSIYFSRKMGVKEHSQTLSDILVAISSCVKH